MFRRILNFVDSFLTYELNPANCNHPELLRALLSQHAHRSILYESEVYQVHVRDNAGNHVQKKVQLTHNLIRYRRKNRSGHIVNEFRYAVEEAKNIGAGLAGVVYRSTHTLFLDHDNQLSLKQKREGKSRIAKHFQYGYFQLNENARTPFVHHEYNMLCLASTVFHPKVTDLNSRVLLSRYFEGNNLLEVIRSHGKQFTFRQRIDLMMKLAECLKELYDVGLVHRDLKSENVIVKLKSDLDIESVQIIDPGFGYNRHIKDGIKGGDCPGSVLYASPQNFNKAKINEKCDVFSLGRVFSEIISGEDVERLIAPYAKDRESAKKYLMNPTMFSMQQLFGKPIKNYHYSQDSKKIYELLGKMMSPAVAERLTLEESIAGLRAIMNPSKIRNVR